MSSSNGAIQFDLLSGLAEQDSSMCPEELAQVKEFTALTAEHGGLLLNSVIPELLQVSRTRWYELRDQYDFQHWEFFGHRWYSCKQLHAFSKIDRSSGRGRPSLLKILKASHEELLGGK